MKELTSAGHPLSVWVVRNGERKLVSVTPDPGSQNRRGIRGLGRGERNRDRNRVVEFTGGQSRLEGWRRLCKRGRPGDPLQSKVHDIINGSGGKPVEM